MFGHSWRQDAIVSACRHNATILFCALVALALSACASLPPSGARPPLAHPNALATDKSFTAPPAA